MPDEMTPERLATELFQMAGFIQAVAGLDTNAVADSLRELGARYSAAWADDLKRPKEIDQGDHPCFDFQLDDGRIAHCWRATQQEYADCTFSAGLVDGIDPDTLYLRLQRVSDEPMMIFMRPDEAAVILYVLAGATWSAAMIGFADVDNAHGHSSNMSDAALAGKEKY